MSAGRHVRDAIDRISYGVIVALMTAMTTIIAVQVALRYLFNGSIDWADETSRLSFVWIVFLAVPHGVKAGIHVGLDLFPALMPPGVRTICAQFNRFVLAVFFIAAGWQAMMLAIRNWGNEMPTIALPSGLFFLALAICCAHSLLHVIWQSRLDQQQRQVVDVL